jgi:pentatricopeptide repeat protein
VCALPLWYIQHPTVRNPVGQSCNALWEQKKNIYPIFHIERNTVTYNTLIAGLGRVGRMEEALALFEEMKRERIKRNTVTYNTLITGLGRVGRMEEDQGGNSNSNKRESQICVNNEI